MAERVERFDRLADEFVREPVDLNPAFSVGDDRIDHDSTRHSRLLDWSIGGSRLSLEDGGLPRSERRANSLLRHRLAVLDALTEAKYLVSGDLGVDSISNGC